MVYVYDLWAQLPVKDLYDTLMMLAAVNAAKDMYEKGEQAIKDFRKDYGDFMSPFAYDTKWYNENFNVANKLGEIYGRGGDPLRNQADRAEMYRWINSRPYADYNNKKLRAANYLTYRKNMAELDAQGAYNPAMELYYLQRLYGPKAVGDPSTWDLDSMGISSWDRLSPIRAKSLKELTESSYNNITPHELTKEQVLSFPGATFDPKQTYTGNTYQDLLDVANTAAPGLKGTPYYDYYLNEAASKVTARGEDLTPNNINKQLARDIANSHIEYLKRPVGSIDNWYKERSLAMQQLRLNIANANRADRIRREEEEKLKGFTFRIKSGSLENSIMFRSGELLEAARKGKTVNDIKLLGSAYYSSRQKLLEGPDLKYGMLLAANYADKENVGLGEYQKRRPIMFGENNLSLKADRIMDHLVSAGVAHIYRDKNDIDVSNPTGLYITPRGEGLSGFLKRNHIQGYIPTESVSVVWDRTGGNDVYDLNFVTRIKKSDIEKYLGKDKLKSLSYLGKKYGLVLVKRDGQKIRKGDSQAENVSERKNSMEWNEIEYIDIPTVRTIFANELDNQMINSHADAVTFTGATGAKRQAGYLNEDEDLDLE